MLTEFLPIDEAGVDVLLGNFKEQAQRDNEKLPRRNRLVRIPLLLLSHDGHIAMSTKPPGSTNAGEKTIPSKNVDVTKLSGTYRTLIGNHIRDNMVLQSANRYFQTNPLGKHRYFSDDRHGIPTTLLTVPAVVLFDGTHDQIGFKYRYQQRYGSITWETLDNAKNVITAQAEQVSASKASIENELLFSMLAGYLEGRSATHS